ncbi:MAG: hypothetical protein H0X02_11930, partial [Nitrosomonas sp.]|nr:hypothetical protein [Nitrosomonas sp.]
MKAIFQLLEFEKEKSLCYSYLMQQEIVDSKPGLTKYGGTAWIVMGVPMRGSLPVKINGREYNDDPYQQDDSDDDEDSAEKTRLARVEVASEVQIESFVTSCRLHEEDLPYYQDAMNYDMRLE